MSGGLDAGDIANMAKLAWSLAETFGSGPTSAIPEFREVQASIFALKAALDALTREAERVDSIFKDQQGQDVLGQLAEDCRRTLLRVEAIVAKYTDKSEGSWTFKKWFKKGFKMIQWTSEGGDIKVLMEELNKHGHNINLFLGILENQGFQAAVFAIQKDKERRVSISFKSSHHANLIKPDVSFASSSLRNTTFEGYPGFFADPLVEIDRKAVKKIELGLTRRNPQFIICPTAALNPELFTLNFKMSVDALFVCTCRTYGGVLAGTHAATIAAIKCGPSTVIIKNEATDAEVGEYIICSPVYEPVVSMHMDDLERRPIVIRVTKSVQAFEASIVQHLGFLAARNLADGHATETKWVRWENEAHQRNTTSVKTDRVTRGRVMVACSVKFGSGAQTAPKNLSIKYIPPHSSKWQGPLNVDNMLIVMYRSIEKTNLYLGPGMDRGFWADGDMLSIYIDLTKFALAHRTLKCEYVSEEPVKVIGSAITFKVSKLSHVSNGEIQEGYGTRTSLGTLLTVSAGVGHVILDRNNLPKSTEEKMSLEATALANALGPIQYQVQEFWSTKVSRRENITATFTLNNISISGGFDDHGNEFYDSTLILLHAASSKRSRLVARGKSGAIVLSQDVSDNDNSAVTIADNDALAVAKPEALFSQLVRDKTGVTTSTTREKRTVLYHFKEIEDPVKCIFKIFELRKTEAHVRETMTLDAAPPIKPIKPKELQKRTVSDSHIHAFELPASESFGDIYEMPADVPGRSVSVPLPKGRFAPPPGIVELPAFALEPNTSYQVYNGGISMNSRPLHLDVEVSLDEERRNILCPSASINPRLLQKPNPNDRSAMALFKCHCPHRDPHFPAVVHKMQEYKVGLFTLPLLAIGGKYSKRPGCFIMVNVQLREFGFIELYVRCKSPAKEREFEDVVGGALRTRAALHINLDKIPEEKHIPIHTEDKDQISLIYAFGNIDVLPKAEMRTGRGGKWKIIAKLSHGLSISHYKTVNREALQVWLARESADFKAPFDDAGTSTLKFKPDNEADFSAHIEGKPKWHAEERSITILMDVSDGVLLPQSGGAESYDGSWKLRFTFSGPTSPASITRKEASQALAWFKFWRNRLEVKRWFILDDDEDELFSIGIEHLETETEHWSFFEGFFREGLISILYDDEFHRLRILSRSADKKRILSQDVLVGILQFDENGMMKSSAEAGSLGHRSLGFTQTCAIADQSHDVEQRCWKLNGLITYLFHSPQDREQFCEKLGIAVSKMEADLNELFPPVHEIGPSERETAEFVELPTFEFSSPALLRRGTMEMTAMPLRSRNLPEIFPQRNSSLNPSPTPSRSPSPKPTIVIPPSLLPALPPRSRSNSATGSMPKIRSSPGTPLPDTLATPLSPPVMSRSRSNPATPLSPQIGADMSRTQSNSTATTFPEYTVYIVTVPYEARAAREMSIKKGEVLRVEEEDDGDYLFAMKRRPGLGGTFRSWDMPGMVIMGWVPKRCLMMEIMDGAEDDSSIF